MTAPAAVSCPGCALPLPLRSAGPFECAGCGSSGVLVSPDPPRSVVEPRLDANDALVAARSGWRNDGVDPRFLAPGGWVAPRLAFAPMVVVERTWRDSRGLREAVFLGPGAELPHRALDAVGPESVLGATTAWDPAVLRRRAVVLDLALDAEEVVPAVEGTLASRTSIVYVPVWLAECRDGRNVYASVIDGLTGALLGGRAPVDPLQRAPQALAIVYALAVVLAVAPLARDLVFRFLLNLQLFAVGVLAVAVGALLTALAWAWDHLRFRHEVVVEAGRRRREVVNRPERTGPEKARDFFLAAVRKVVK